MDTVRQQIERRYSYLMTEGANWRVRWRELSSYITPYTSRFQSTDRNRGTEKNYWILNEAATNACDTLSAGMMSGMTSPARPWFKLMALDPALNELKVVKVWLDLVQQRMADIFLRSNLYTTLPMTYSDLGVYGTAAFLLERDDENVIRCQPFTVGSYYFANGARGMVDTCYRIFQMTARQLSEKFGEENCSDAVKAALEGGKSADAWFEVIHAVEPNPEFDPSRKLGKFKKFRSVYLERGAAEGRILREAGYDSFPVMATRWSVTGEDAYGSSPGMKVLGVVKALQVRERRFDQAVEKMNNPPINAPVSIRKSPLSTLPGGVNYVSQMGDKVEPTYVLNPAMLAPLSESIEKAERRIAKAFFADLFLMIANDDRSGMTATEILERKEEKMLMLGPVLERLNDELLDPLIGRTFDMMMELNVVPPPPPELHGQSLNVEYISILAQARKLQNVTSIQQTAAYVQSIAPQFPDVLDTFDSDASVQAFADAVGVPPLLIRDAMERAQIRAQRAQAQQAQQAMAQAQQGASVMQKLGATQVTPDNALGALAQRMGVGA